MRFTKWHIAPAEEAGGRRHVSRAAGYPQLVAAGARRPRHRAAGAGRRLSGAGPGTDLLPFLMQDMDKAVERISRAISQGETHRRVRRLRRGRHHLHLPADRLSALAAARTVLMLHPPPHRGGLRPRLRCHPRPCRAGRHAASSPWTAASPAWRRRRSPPPWAWTWSSPTTTSARTTLPAAVRRGGPPPAGLRLSLQASGRRGRGARSWSWRWAAPSARSALFCPLLHPGRHRHRGRRHAHVRGEPGAGFIYRREWINLSNT